MTDTTTGTETAPLPTTRDDAEKLRSDMDAIKNVLKRSQTENEPHRMLIAGANFVCGFFLLLGSACIVLFMMIPLFAAPFEEGLIAFGVGIIVALFLALISLPFLVAGWGLMKRKRWAPAAAVVTAILNVFNIPLGTAISIYTFWAVLKGKLETPVSPSS